MHSLIRRFLSVVPITALAVSLTVVDIGMFAVGPGPAREVGPLIEVDGVETHAGRGRLLLTTVSVGRVRAPGAAMGLFDAAVEIVPEHEVIPRGVTEEEYQRESRSLMDESKIAAVSVVLRMLTDYPDAHGRGALVQDVVDGSPADGLVFPGDLILAADDRPVRDVDHLAALIRRTGGERAMTLTVEVDGEERTIRVRPERVDGEEHPILGVILVASFPFDVLIDSGAIGGPSAGLMWALGVYDLLTVEDLLDGREVAGTGVVRLNGEVGPVGGIEQKVRAAERAEADLFVLPADNLRIARQVADGIRLVPVRSVEDAVRALTETGA